MDAFLNFRGLGQCDRSRGDRTRGLFRHIYRKDTKANRLNEQKGSRSSKQSERFGSISGMQTDPKAELDQPNGFRIVKCFSMI